MRTTVISAKHLTSEHIEKWGQIQQANPALASPFFRPEFTQAVASVRNDALVAVIDDSRAFFPFQREMFGIGRPIGGPVTDYQGLIAPPDCTYDSADLVRACGLRVWDFDHVPADQTMFSQWRNVETASPVVDVRGAEPVGSTELRSQYARRRRKLEREVGPVEVEMQSGDLEMLRLCREWKSSQYLRTRKVDLFARPWARDLTDRIFSCRDENFAGVLSVLRAGGKPIAAHFGLRSRDTWHYWFPSYDPAYSAYSPGILLLLSMISHAPEIGVATIDFGKGDMVYKQRLANRFIPLIEGSVAASPWINAVRNAQFKLPSWAKQVPLVKPASAKVRKLAGQLEQIWVFR
jgi:CelD/BcsL family acetyltransferase involved in cellulose biosynthesis